MHALHQAHRYQHQYSHNINKVRGVKTFPFCAWTQGRLLVSINYLKVMHIFCSSLINTTLLFGDTMLLANSTKVKSVKFRIAQYRVLLQADIFPLNKQNLMLNFKIFVLKFLTTEFNPSISSRKEENCVKNNLVFERNLMPNVIGFPREKQDFNCLETIYNKHSYLVQQ